MPPGDRPDDAVINDDERADAWYAQWTRDAARSAATAKARSGSKRPAGQWQDAGAVAFGKGKGAPPGSA
jgi:hypothetical protein